MLSTLLDNLTSALGGRARDANWARVIDAFLRRHPDVHVCDHPLREQHAPGGFIVWRMGQDDARCSHCNACPAVPAGSYAVQLFASREDAETEAYGKRFGAEGVAFASTAAEAGNRTVITGIGTFDADAAPGELTSSLHDGSFNMMVLYEDGPRYARQHS
jgi:hypothetical protein